MVLWNQPDNSICFTYNSQEKYFLITIENKLCLTSNLFLRSGAKLKIICLSNNAILLGNTEYYNMVIQSLYLILYSYFI